MTAVSVHVVTIDCDGDALADLLADAGHTVSGPSATTLEDLATAIRTAPGADAVCVLGELGPTSVVASALEQLLDVRLPGFGEACRRALADTAPGEAMLSRAMAGTSGGMLVFAVPSGADSVPRAGGLVLQALQHVEPSDRIRAEPIPFGGARGANMGLSVSENREPEPAKREAAADAEQGPEPGWKRAIAALGAEILVGRREDLPESIEKLAPVVNVLHTAGETGTMKLPSGRRYSLWGWPDLQRSSSKVLAVSWGEPLAEVVALHRHPAQAGTCIEGDSGLLPDSGSDVAEACTRVCGRAPANTEGTLFAISSDSVWILRSRRVIKWDGSREKDDGNPKQVLASLTLHWSNR